MTTAIPSETHAGRIVEVDHPLIRHKLTLLRRVETDTQQFRMLVEEIANLLTYEATHDLETEQYEINTPLTKMKGDRVSGKKVAVVPVLRAGLGMVDGVLRMVPVARIGHIGLYRDEESLQPVTYYEKLPDDMEDRDVLLLDPMLATGGSLTVAVDKIKASGASRIRILAILAAPEGIDRIHTDHPDVDIYVAGIDECLNDQGYIVPGLGDAGDRLFGTK